VARLHPDLAFDYAVTNWDRVAPMTEEGARQRYVPWLASSATDASMIAKLERFAAKHIDKGARQDLRKSEAAIRYTVRIRETRLPQVDRWLQKSDGAGGRGTPSSAPASR
jgi:hypothetical protein